MMALSNSTEESDHEGLDHLTFKEFQLWNRLSSTVLLVVVMVLGCGANIFISYCIYKKRIGTKYVNPVLLAISVKNTIAISTCLPLAIVMLNFPSAIMKLSCDIQEHITYIVGFSGFLFPALLSMVQCDHIVRPQRQLLSENKVIYALCGVTAVSVLMGIQSKFSNDNHECHLWSIITDKIVLAYIYSITAVVFISLITMVTCYVIIYYQARAQEEALEASTQKSRNPTEGTSAGNVIDTQVKPVAKEMLPLRRKMTTAILKPMLCIVTSNIVTSLPWIIFYMFSAYDKIESSAHYAEVRILIMSIMYISVASDPCIFLAFSSKGKKTLTTFFRRNRATVTPYQNTQRVSTIPANRNQVQSQRNML